MKHAFLITAYTDAKQLKDLIESLNSTDSFFYIHLDKKSSIQDDEEITSLQKLNNVHFIKNSIPVYWGGYSHLQVFLLLMNEASKNKEINYIHTLSGQCYPIVSRNKIQEFFTENKGKEFIMFTDLSSLNWSGGSFNRIQLYHLNDWFNIRAKFWKRINSRFLQLQLIFGVKRKLSASFKNYYGGGTWWSLSIDAVKYIQGVINDTEGLLKKFKHTHCSEEIFFQTILLNSSFKDKIVSDDLRYVDWNTRDGNCPAILNETDFEQLKNSEKLFARKFASGISDSLKNKLTG